MTPIKCALLLAIFFSHYVDSSALFPGHPGVNSPQKLWFTKILSSDLYATGRLTERQIKYSLDAGFKSIITLFKFEQTGSVGANELPTTEKAQDIAEKFGMKFRAILDSEEDWYKVRTIETLTVAIQEMPKPILLHCHRGHTITFATLMFMANQTKVNPNYTPRITSDVFYTKAASLGLDFALDNTMKVVSEITGEKIPEDPPKPNSVPSEWMDFWYLHPVDKNWFVAGQLTYGQLTAVARVGVKHIINLRLSPRTRGRPTQETVNLLNIIDNTPTYSNSIMGPRQSVSSLLSSRINETQTKDFISVQSHVNYEEINKDEYGDVVGYNEDLEREAMESTNIQYYNIAIDEQAVYSTDLYEEYGYQLLNIGATGEPVIVHCSDTRRASYMTVLTAAVQNHKSLAWATGKLKELGWDITSGDHKGVLEMYQKTLEI